MRRSILASSLLALLLSVGCSDNSTNSNWDPLGKTGDDPELIYLDYGQTVAVDDGQLKLSFVGPIYDARCGANEYCDWEGFAEIKLRVTGPNGDSTVVMPALVQTYPEVTATAADIFGYRIQLIELMPYPGVASTNVDTSTWFKKATLEVQKQYDSVPDPVIITNINPKGLLVQGYDKIDSILIDHNVLKIRVRHSGGCQRHYFQLFMSPAGFVESDSVQADLYLRHFGIPDICMAWSASWVEVDLTPIANLYRQTYGQDGDVTLNIADCYSTIQTPPCLVHHVTFNTALAPDDK